MKLKTIALMGAGAVGAMFITGFMNTCPEDFCLIASGERAERLSRDGVTINGTVFRPAVKTPEEARGADLLIIASKYSGLKEGMGDIRTIADGHTLVISALNGIDSEELLSAALGAEVMPAFMKIVSRRTGSSITYNPERTIGLIFGERSGIRTERAGALDALLTACGIPHRVSDDILTEQWSKFALNLGANLPQAMLGVDYGAYIDSAHVAFLRDRLYDEVTQVAAKLGITVAPDHYERGQNPDTARFSTLQDLDNGRLTEIDMFAGVLTEKGREVGVPTPYAECALHVIHALEEKNAGKFRY